MLVRVTSENKELSYNKCILRIIQILKHFSHASCTHKQKEDQSAQVDIMFRWDPQYKLQVKGVQLSH